jgi:flagellar basal-body rod protein FlgC
MSLLSALSVPASGMAAQRARTEVLVENLANSETTRTAEGGPYRRKDVVFTTSPQGSLFADVFQKALEPNVLEGVEVTEVSVDQRDPEKRFQPGHPDADAEGYVSYPRINPAEDMVDLLSASRAFQANVSAAAAVKDMIYRSLDLLK